MDQEYSQNTECHPPYFNCVFQQTTNATQPSLSAYYLAGII